MTKAEISFKYHIGQEVWTVEGTGYWMCIEPHIITGLVSLGDEYYYILNGQESNTSEEDIFESQELAEAKLVQIREEESKRQAEQAKLDAKRNRLNRVRQVLAYSIDCKLAEDRELSREAINELYKFAKYSNANSGQFSTACKSVVISNLAHKYFEMLNDSIDLQEWQNLKTQLLLDAYREA